jgi:hypothetical protein
MLVFFLEKFRDALRDCIRASTCEGGFLCPISLGEVESKSRGLGSDRGYRVMNTGRGSAAGVAELTFF